MNHDHHTRIDSAKPRYLPPRTQDVAPDVYALVSTVADGAPWASPDERVSRLREVRPLVEQACHRTDHAALTHRLWTYATYAARHALAVSIAGPHDLLTIREPMEAVIARDSLTDWLHVARGKRDKSMARSDGLRNPSRNWVTSGAASNDEHLAEAGRWDQAAVVIAEAIEVLDAALAAEDADAVTNVAILAIGAMSVGICLPEEKRNYCDRLIALVKDACEVPA